MPIKDIVIKKKKPYTYSLSPKRIYFLNSPIVVLVIKILKTLKNKNKNFRKTLYLLSFKRIYFLNSPFVLLVPASHTSEEETNLGTPILNK